MACSGTPLPFFFLKQKMSLKIRNNSIKEQAQGPEALTHIFHVLYHCQIYVQGETDSVTFSLLHHKMYTVRQLENGTDAGKK
jgi:hypothetical protein